MTARYTPPDRHAAIAYADIRRAVRRRARRIRKRLSEEAGKPHFLELREFLLSGLIRDVVIHRVRELRRERVKIPPGAITMTRAVLTGQLERDDDFDIGVGLEDMLRGDVWDIPVKSE